MTFENVIYRKIMGRSNSNMTMGQIHSLLNEAAREIQRLDKRLAKSESNPNKPFPKSDNTLAGDLRNLGKALSEVKSVLEDLETHEELRWF